MPDRPLPSPPEQLDACVKREEPEAARRMRIAAWLARSLGRYREISNARFTSFEPNEPVLHRLPGVARYPKMVFRARPSDVRAELQAIVRGVDPRIAVRMALGARPRQVLAAILATTRWALVGGLAVGFALSLGAGVLLRRQLFGLSPLDRAAHGAVLTILAGAALVATFVPARRAVRVDRAVTLRTE